MSTGLPRLSECRTCQAPIRFVKLASGKAMPVNPQPNPEGNVAARLVGGGLHGHVISRDHPAPKVGHRFVAHYATCEAVRPVQQKTTAPADPALF